MSTTLVDLLIEVANEVACYLRGQTLPTVRQDVVTRIWTDEGQRTLLTAQASLVVPWPALEAVSSAMASSSSVRRFAAVLREGEAPSAPIYAQWWGSSTKALGRNASPAEVCRGVIKPLAARALWLCESIPTDFAERVLREFDEWRSEGLRLRTICLIDGFRPVAPLHSELAAGACIRPIREEDIQAFLATMSPAFLPARPDELLGASHVVEVDGGLEQATPALDASGVALALLGRSQAHLSLATTVSGTRTLPLGAYERYANAIEYGRGWLTPSLDQLAALPNLYLGVQAHRGRPRVGAAIRWWEQGRFHLGLADKLVAYCIALEALFGPVEEQGEIALRLALRVAWFARQSGHSAVDAYSHVKGAYGRRSFVVHGSHETKKRKQPTIAELQGDVEWISDLLRSAILDWLAGRVTPDPDAIEKEMLGELDLSL